MEMRKSKIRKRPVMGILKTVIRGIVIVMNTVKSSMNVSQVILPDVSGWKIGIFILLIIGPCIYEL